MKRQLNNLAANIGRRLVRWAQRDSNYLRHAQSEWRIAFPNGGEMQSIYEAIDRDRRARAKADCVTCQGKGWKKVWNAHDPAITDCHCLAARQKGQNDE